MAAADSKELRRLADMLEWLEKENGAEKASLLKHEEESATVELLYPDKLEILRVCKGTNNIEKRITL